MANNVLIAVLIITAFFVSLLLIYVGIMQVTKWACNAADKRAARNAAREAAGTSVVTTRAETRAEGMV